MITGPFLQNNQFNYDILLSENWMITNYSCLLTNLKSITADYDYLHRLPHIWCWDN